MADETQRLLDDYGRSAPPAQFVRPRRPAAAAATVAAEEEEAVVESPRTALLINDDGPRTALSHAHSSFLAQSLSPATARGASAAASAADAADAEADAAVFAHSLQQRHQLPRSTSSALLRVRSQRRSSYRLKPLVGFVPPATRSSIVPPPLATPPNAAATGAGGDANLTSSTVYAQHKTLAALDRDALARLKRGHLLLTGLGVVGMLFVWALWLTGLSAVFALRRTLTKRRFLERTHRGLLRTATVFALLAVVLSFADFGVSVWLALTRGFETMLWWWGATMVPGTYPIFIAHLVINARAFNKSTQNMHSAAWDALARTSEHLKSITTHYRISQRHIVPAVPVESDISVFVNPDQATRRWLLEVGIEETMLEDALDPFAEASIEFHTGHMSAIVRWPNSLNEREPMTFPVGTCGLFLFANRLIVVLCDTQPLFEGRFFDRVDTLQDVAVQILRTCTKTFERNLRLINASSDELEGDVERSLDNRVLMSNFQLQKSLVYHLNALSSNLHVLEMMAEKLDISARTMTNLHLAISKTSQCQKTADIFLAVVSGLVDARAAVIGNNLNVMMKNMNALAIAMSFGTFLSGVGGMSEFTLVIGEKNMAVGYGLFLLGSACLSVTVFLLINWTAPLWARTGANSGEKQKRS